MTVEIKICHFLHEELTDILCTAFYGNPYMDIDYEGTPSTIHSNFESNVAQVLLDGGTVLITDNNSSNEEKGYGDLPRYLDNDGFLTYKVTLNDIFKGASTLGCLRMIEDILSGEGDMYTGWNLMQTILFGEVVYG